MYLPVFISLTESLCEYLMLRRKTHEGGETKRSSLTNSWEGENGEIERASQKIAPWERIRLTLDTDLREANADSRAPGSPPSPRPLYIDSRSGLGWRSDPPPPFLPLLILRNPHYSSRDEASGESDQSGSRTATNQMTFPPFFLDLCTLRSRSQRALSATFCTLTRDAYVPAHRPSAPRCWFWVWSVSSC